MDDFSRNPCRSHLFEIFGLDKSETDLRALRSAVQTTRDRLRFGKIKARDGSEIELTEADSNALEEKLFDPLQRLQVEQLVHQEHLFAKDPELISALDELKDEDPAPLTVLVEEARPQVLLAVLQAFLPSFEPPVLAVDLPWPEEPESFGLHREPLEDVILRER